MPYTPQQNGCSERDNRTLVEAVRAMRLAHEKLPQALWAELINTAAYILNHTGPSSVDGKSQHELWYNKKPKITHLRIIGCTAYVHVLHQRRKKMDSKAKKGVLVGYEGDDGYRILLQPGNRICRSRDVIFDEKIITSTTAHDWPVNTNPEVHEDKDVREPEVEKNGEPSDDEEETVIDDSNCDRKNVTVMQLCDRKNIDQPCNNKDYVLSAEAMFSPCEPECFEEAVHSNQSVE